VDYAKLVEEWDALLTRRPSFREPLAPYGDILTAWMQWSPECVRPLSWGADECLGCWQRGVPLLAEAPLSVPPNLLEDLLAPAMALLDAVGTESDALSRFAEAWDRREVGLEDLLPAPGRIGSPPIQQRLGLSTDFLAFLGAASLRPVLEAYLAGCRPHLGAHSWDLGICPFCGAPPGFADLLEDGKRRLACHLCGAGWLFSRLRCAYCGTRNSSDLIAMQAEDAEEGYGMTACHGCRGYLKELDRRVRWNAGPALVEDWGSPHLDLIAHRRGYWRAIPSLVQLQKPDGAP
jgi:FdhE protein